MVMATVGWAVSAAMWHWAERPSTPEAVGPWVVCALVLVAVVRATAKERVVVPLVLEVCDEVPKGRRLVVVSY